MDENPHMRRLQFRAWHRGTKENDLMIGGFFDRYHREWNADDIAWFEMLLEEEDVEIMAWCLGNMPAPERLKGPMLDKFLKLDFIPTA